MVIAMVAVLVVQTTVYQIVNMVAMRYGFVSATCAVLVFVVSVCLTLCHGVAP